MTDKEIKTKTIEHPLESVFDIEDGSTLVEYQESPPTELIQHIEYDQKDAELEHQFQTIYDRAMDVFDEQSEAADLVEGKYKARNAEVAAQYLNTALNAIKEKAGMKSNKDKLEATKIKSKQPGTVNQTLVVADHNEILKLLQKGNTANDE